MQCARSITLSYIFLDIFPEFVLLKLVNNRFFSMLYGIFMKIYVEMNLKYFPFLIWFMKSILKQIYTKKLADQKNRNFLCNITITSP